MNSIDRGCQQNLSSPVILQQCFRDVDELAEAISVRRRLEVNQLSLQESQSTLLLTKFDQIQFFVIETVCPLRIVGPKNPDVIEFACILQPGRSGLISHHVEVTPEIVFGFDPDRPIDLVLPSGIKMANIQVARSAFQDCLKKLDRTDIDPTFLSQNYLRSPFFQEVVASYLKELFWQASHQTALLRQNHLQRLVLEDFLPLLINTFPTSKRQRMKSPTPLRRAQLVHQVEDYMYDHLDEPLTLKDLCIALNTSSRALNYGFQDVFNMSPMAYLKVLRLHGLRRALKMADPITTSIGDVAAKFGFWSLGHLSRDYQATFGERLSQTLKQSSLKSTAWLDFIHSGLT